MLVSIVCMERDPRKIYCGVLLGKVDIYASIHCLYLALSTLLCFMLMCSIFTQCSILLLYIYIYIYIGWGVKAVLLPPVCTRQHTWYLHDS